MPTTNKTSIARKGGAIRLTLPAKVANDFKLLDRSLRALAEDLGHPECQTGCDYFFVNLQREFTVRGDDVALNPQPLPPRDLGLAESRGTVTVTIPDKVSGNIDSLIRATGVVLGKLGCSACCSGFDILFRREINSLALDEKGGVARFGGVA